MMTKEEATKLYLEILEQTKGHEPSDGLLAGSSTEILEEYDPWLDEPWTEEELKSFKGLETEELEEWK